MTDQEKLIVNKGARYLRVDIHTQMLDAAKRQAEQEHRADRLKAALMEDTVADLVLCIKGILDETLPIERLQGEVDAVLQRIVPHLDARYCNEILDGGDRVARAYERGGN